MAVGGLLDRLRTLENNDLKTITKTLKNGNLTVENVPYTEYPGGLGPDGESTYLASNVMYKLTKIFKYMMDNKIKQVDYNKMDSIV